jgi:hypothetical protein
LSGFCQEAFELVCTVRFFQPHCPAGTRFWFACTETQYVPGPSETCGLSGIEKLGPFVKF